ncbi:MAG: right-handed parallel beta-helix repeat-containing protein, partial [Bacteroidota bacterium]|nr:right-handed parallel beta-helix repeat-containing protein [Bacteroidota bacterium]
MFRFTQFSKKLKLVFSIGLFMFGALSVDTANAQSPCTPSANTNGRCCSAASPIGLGTVTFGSSISNTTSYNGSKNYYDFTSISACVNAGSSYSMQVNTAGNSYDQAICVWIDWNANGTFSVSELVLRDSFVQAGGNVSGNIDIPSGQTSGVYRMRVMGDYYAFYAFSNPAPWNPCQGYYSEYHDYTITVASTSGIDIAATTIASPSTNSVPLNQDFDIELIVSNLAGTTIDTVEVGYIIDNGSATTKTVTGLNLASCNNSSAINVATTAKITSAGSHTLRVWVNKPNGTNPDANVNNDTITTYVCTSLTGNFTIDAGSAASSTNFVDFTSAVAKLNNCGISGAVKFTVASGTYTEQITLKDINGASSSNTITFDGVDATTRTLTTSSSGTTFKFDGASYVTVKNLTIENTSSSNAIAVQLMNVSEFNSFDSCLIKVTNNNYPNIAFGAMDGAYYNSGDFANNTTVDHSEISGGYMTVVFSGDYNKSNYSNKFKNTYIHGGAYYGVYFTYQDSALFQNCEITANNGYPLMMQYVKYSDILNNDIHGGYYAFYSYNLNTSNVINNQIYNSQYAAIYAYDGSNVIFYHNSVYNDYASNPYAMYIYAGTGWDVRNNIFALGGNSGYAFYVSVASALTSCDNNVYFTGSSSNYVYIGSAYSNMAALTNNPNGMNSNIFNSAPSFLSMSSPVDLHISSANASPRGDGSVGVTTDIDGDARCAFAPTIGCDESKHAAGTIKASFTMPDTAFINSPVVVLNGNGPKMPAAHQWFDDCSLNASPVASSRNFNNTWSATGTFQVKLVTQSCSGFDTLCKTIVIVNPTKAPNTDFIASGNSVEQEEQVDFTDLTTEGPTTWTWEISGGYDQGSGV